MIPLIQGYTDETGLREIVERGSNRLSEVQLVKEKNIMNRFMKEVLSTKGNLATYGLKQIVMALEMGAVDHLLICLLYTSDSADE